MIAIKMVFVRFVRGGAKNKFEVGPPWRGRPP